MLIDTHCHIHEGYYKLDVDEVIFRAKQAGVEKLICVGTDFNSSKKAIELALRYKNVFASVGFHPHETKINDENIEKLIDKTNRKIVAIGEIGLDYFYDHSPRDIQKKVLIDNIELAIKYDLPVIFHVRQAFDDFWPILDSFLNKGHKIRGVLHSFMDTFDNAKKGLDRGLYIGVNGAVTFIKDEQMKDMFNKLPLDRIMFETDAPFLTPAPFRGKVNESAFIRNIAEYYGVVRQISIDDIERISTENALELFNL